MLKGSFLKTKSLVEEQSKSKRDIVFGKIARYITNTDLSLLGICIILTCISCSCLYGLYHGGNIYTTRPILIQAGTSIMGVLVAFIVSSIDYEILAKIWKIHLPITIFLVVLTFFIGEGGLEGSDEKAWLNIGFTSFQPAEILKLSFIYTFSLHLSKVKSHINEFRHFIILCLHGALPTLLIVFQKDMGMALIFFIIFVIMMFMAGLSIKFFVVGLSCAIVVAPFVWSILLPQYLKERFYVALNPEEYIVAGTSQTGMQQYQGRISMGAGQLSGRGLFNESLYRVPIGESDFILAYIGQFFGFVGSAITLLLLLILCIKILLIAKNSKDSLGKFICTGVFAMFLSQTIINTGMVLCVSPVIGVTLPFLSAGGTSAFVSYVSIGMVLGVYRFKQQESMFI